MNVFTQVFRARNIVVELITNYFTSNSERILPEVTNNYTVKNHGNLI